MSRILRFIIVLFLSVLVGNLVGSMPLEGWPMGVVAGAWVFVLGFVL